LGEVPRLRGFHACRGVRLSLRLTMARGLWGFLALATAGTLLQCDATEETSFLSAPMSCEESRRTWPAQVDTSENSQERLEVLALMVKLVYALKTQVNTISTTQVIFDGWQFGPIQQAGYRLYDITYNRAPHERGCFFQRHHSGHNPSTYVPTFCMFEHTQASKLVFVIPGVSSEWDKSVTYKTAIGGAFPTRFMSWTANQLSNCWKLKHGCLVVGHSLGGYLAEVVATHLRMPGVAFAAPGPDGLLTGHSGTARCGFAPHPWFRVVNYWKDPVGNLMWPRNSHAVQPAFLEGLEGHYIDDLLARFEKAPYLKSLTNQNLIDWTSGQRESSYGVWPAVKTRPYYVLPQGSALHTLGRFGNGTNETHRSSLPDSPGP
jgi:pimeloyl-ACP methyl ester carboxylesterase